MARRGRGERERVGPPGLIFLYQGMYSTYCSIYIGYRIRILGESAPYLRQAQIRAQRWKYVSSFSASSMLLISIQVKARRRIRIRAQADLCPDPGPYSYQNWCRPAGQLIRSKGIITKGPYFMLLLSGIYGAHTVFN